MVSSNGSIMQSAGPPSNPQLSRLSFKPGNFRETTILQVRKPYKLGPVTLQRGLQVITVALYGVLLLALINFLISVGMVDLSSSRVIAFVNLVMIAAAAIRFTSSVFNEPENYEKRKSLRMIVQLLMLANFLNGLDYVHEHMTPNRISIILTCGMQVFLSLIWLMVQAWQLELEEEFLTRGVSTYGLNQ